MKKLIVANWKMYPDTLASARRLFERSLCAAVQAKSLEVVICPPTVYLAGLHKPSKGNVALGVQDIFWADQGAYTGEVGPKMAKSAGALYTIVGHSERRALADDTDEIVAKKVRLALVSGLRPIVCVGELERSGDGSGAIFVKHQLQKSLQSVSKNYASRLVIAYEPVWAISSHKPTVLDTPEATLEMALYIRRVLHTLYGSVIAKKIRVLYGGSVSAKNGPKFLTAGGVDGLLVGRASIQADEFASLLRLANELL